MVDKEGIENLESDADFGLELEMITVSNDQDITDCMLMLTWKCGPNFQHIQRKGLKSMNRCAKRH